MKGHQRGRDWQLPQRRDTTNLVKARTSWIRKHFNYFISHFSDWNSIPVDLCQTIQYHWSNKLTLNWFLPEKKQQKQTLFRQLSDGDTTFMIGPSNQDEQTESRDNMISTGNPSDNASNPTQINYLQVDEHTLEETFSVNCEVKWIMWGHLSKLESETRYWLQKNFKWFLELNWLWSMPMRLQNEVLTVMYWNPIREFFRYYQRPTSGRFQ